MSYTALYRKWRPTTFEEVKGQGHIVTTLKNQIVSDRVGHAYLFCGTRGTGKTTIAKIFAKAVNCEHPVDGSPCGECPTCKAIAAGASMNVIEIDAASNNGVDNIREIKEEVTYSPAEGKYKVYIIDEVHMLSSGAFNALLKTLEEPPSYVIFILATTEVHKIPVTILSRCQRYDFKRISVDTITERLNEVMAADGIQAEEKAVRYIAKQADGAMRDALSLLDQCAAFYFDGTLTLDQVLDVLGAVDTKVFSEFLRNLMARNIPETLDTIENIVLQGRDLKQFVTDFTWYLRNLLLLRSTDGVEERLDLSTESQLALKEEAEMINAETLMRYIRIFSELSDSIRYASQKRVLMELAVIRICKPSMETDITSLLERIRVLEEKLESGYVAGPAAADREDDEEDDNTPLPDAGELVKALDEDIKKIATNWPAIMEKIPSGASAFMKTAKLTVKEDKLMIVTVDKMTAEYLNRDLTRSQISKTLNRAIGKDVDFIITGLEEGQNFKKQYVDLSQVIKMEIETED